MGLSTPVFAALRLGAVLTASGAGKAAKAAGAVAASDTWLKPGANEIF